MLYIFKLFYKYFFSGTVAEGGSWGGAVCAAAVSRSTHTYETIFWIFVGLILFLVLDLQGEYDRIYSGACRYYKKLGPPHGLLRVVEVLVGAIEACIWLLVLYYKINKYSICYFLQPCHIVTVIQSYVLLFDTPTSSVVAALSLSMVTGTILAIFVPDTTGLDQPGEATMYWVQHYIIQIVPIFLLLRNNCLLLKLTTFKTILFANWGVLMIHWCFYEIMDVTFNVNVMFMLCPTQSMTATFLLFPPWMFVPSYRSTLTFILFVASIPFAYCYILPSHFLSRFFYTASVDVSPRELRDADEEDDVKKKEK